MVPKSAMAKESDNLKFAGPVNPKRAMSPMTSPTKMVEKIVNTIGDFFIIRTSLLDIIIVHTSEKKKKFTF